MGAKNSHIPTLQDSKLIQTPYPRAKAIDQVPALCPTCLPSITTPPAHLWRLDIDRCIFYSSDCSRLQLLSIYTELLISRDQVHYFCYSLVIPSSFIPRQLYVCYLVFVNDIQPIIFFTQILVVHMLYTVVSSFPCKCYFSFNSNLYNTLCTKTKEK